MSTPRGTRCVKVSVGEADAVHVYSNAHQIVLQLRRSIPTETDITSPSFKVAVALAPGEALRVASELLAAASLILKQSPEG